MTVRARPARPGRLQTQEHNRRIARDRPERAPTSPQASLGCFQVRWLPFVDDMAERDAGTFDGSDVIAEIHQNGRVRRKFFEPECASSFWNWFASTHVDCVLRSRNRAGVPDGTVAGDQPNANNASTQARRRRWFQASARTARCTRSARADREGGKQLQSVARRCSERMATMAE